MPSLDTEAAYQVAYARYRAAVVVYQHEVFAAYMTPGSDDDRKLLLEAARQALYAEARLLVDAAKAREAVAA
jgi:hypothetical protein